MKVNFSVFAGLVALSGLVGCAANPPKNEPMTPPAVVESTRFMNKALGFRNMDKKNRFPANSYHATCQLSPAGVFFGQSERLSTQEVNPEANRETDTHLISENDGDLGSLTDICENIAKGKTFTFQQKEAAVTVTMQILTVKKTLGSWNSSTDLPEPDKHCAPSSDFNAYVSSVQFTYKKDNTVRTAKGDLYYIASGSYHGYWGQGDCQEP